MKEKFIKIIAILSCILPLAAIGHAQINKYSEFEVPFEFVVRDKVFPAGKYTLRSVTDHKTGWLITEKSEAKNLAFLLANTVRNAGLMSENKLTFRRYGNRYFLVEFTLADYQITLPKTKVEEILKRDLLAGNKSAQAELVAIKASLQTR